jgi:hypothetical protein
MSTIRSGKAPRQQEPLAFIWLRTPKQKSMMPPYFRHFSETVTAGARRRAEQLGCTLEEFWLDDGDLKPERLNHILRARGITGFVLSTATSNEPVTLTWDWTPFATAIIGHTQFSPPLHRAAHHHYLGLCSALQRLKAEGCQRPAAIFSRSVQDRVHQMQVGAFLANHPNPEIARDLTRFSLPEKFSELSPWPAAIAPDALIIQWQIDQSDADLLRAKFPSVRRIVTLDWHPNGVLAGIDPTYGEIAAKAMDLVVEQLHANTIGLPARPTSLLLEGVWREADIPDPINMKGVPRGTPCMT